MTIIFKEMLANIVGCYVDLLVTKMQQRNDNLEHLQAVFNKLRKHQLKMNLLKCSFRVTSRKIKAMMELHSPKSL